MTNTKAVIGMIIVTATSVVFSVNAFFAANTLRVQRDEAQKQVKLVQEVYDKSVENFAEVFRLNIALQHRVNDTHAQLESMKGRESIAAAKPKLVEKMINTSFDKFEKDLACVTGSSSDCQ